jgi:inosose dehydratase
MARRYGGRINHVHTKDVRADVLKSLDRERQSFLDAVLAGVFTVPGDGMLDFKAVAKLCAEIGYEGWFVVEAEQDPAKANPLQYAKIGHEALTEALTAAGYDIAS